jgi:serine/threonine protein kinase
MSWSLFQRDPRRLGPYEVIAKIGKGSAGSVFKARHTGTGAVVAIKVLGLDSARDPISMKRFEQEFHATRSLISPHIVHSLDFGREGAAPYLVMEFVEGISLTNHLKSVGRMTERDALRMIVQVAQALHYSHERGMIHRDVNPGNIMLSADGQARLTDFGLVKSMDSGQNLTVTAMSLGTPCFMAPEQFHDAKRIDRRCDVYGLAATLYKALTGVSPYNSRALGATVRLKLNGEITAPRLLIPGLSMRVDWAIMRALSVSPAMRQDSCAAFVRDLTGKDLMEPSRPERAASADGVRSERPVVERRAAIRYPCRLPSLCLPTRDKGQKSWEAEVTNISTQGLGIVLGRRFERGTVLELAWSQIHQDVAGSLMARVARTQAHDPGSWFLGCELAHLLGDDDIRALLAATEKVGA